MSSLVPVCPGTPSSEHLTTRNFPYLNILKKLPHRRCEQWHRGRDTIDIVYNPHPTLGPNREYAGCLSTLSTLQLALTGWLSLLLLGVQCLERAAKAAIGDADPSGRRLCSF